MSTEQNKPGEEQSSSGDSVTEATRFADLQNSRLMEMMANKLVVEEEPDTDEDGKPFIITVTQR